MLDLPTTEERLGKSPQRLVRYFVLTMALVYLGLGVWMLWSASKPITGGVIELTPMVRRVLGIIFILYGLVRFWRGYQTHFSKPSPPDNHE